MTILDLYINADLSDVADVSRLSKVEQTVMLELFEKVCDRDGKED